MPAPLSLRIKEGSMAMRAGGLSQQMAADAVGIWDFTLLKGRPITIGGEVHENRMFHIRLPNSGWCHVEVIYGDESCVAPSANCSATRRIVSSREGSGI